MTDVKCRFLLSEVEATALIELGAALEPFIRRDTPLDTATAKLDEQLASQRQEPKWIVDDVAEVLWDAVEALRDVHPDDPVVRDWAAKLVEQVIGEAP